MNANRVRIAAMKQTWDLFSKYDVVLTRLYDAPREDVFDAWSSEERLLREADLVFVTSERLRQRAAKLPGIEVTGTVSDADKDYLGQLVAQNTQTYRLTEREMQRLLAVLHCQLERAVGRAA